MKNRGFGFLRTLGSFLAQFFRSYEEEMWEEILEDANKEHQRGNNNFFAIAFVSNAYDEWVHERIVEMLFIPDVPRPAWLRFEHVIDRDTPDEVVRFVVDALDDLQIRLNYTLDNENTRTFKAFLLERSQQHEMKAA